MELDAPDFLRALCEASLIRPVSHYVQRNPWSLRDANVAEAFLGRMGLYCFWWSGPRRMFLDRLTRYKYRGEGYPGGTRHELEHGMIPAYVGMTANAARRVGRRLEGRMVDRLVRFNTGMSYWLTSRKESRLTCPPTGMTNFTLFNFPERIRARVAAVVGRPDLSLTDAQEYLIENGPACRVLIAEFHEEYLTLMYDNYSISFVPFASETDLFYAEALSIGVLRPCLNHS